MNGRGHFEDCGWVEDPEPRDDEPRPEQEYDGPMPEAEVGWD